MVRRDSPYVYGDDRPGAALEEAVDDESDPVIVDGSVMSFRSYRRRLE
jgi:hypothetical protein